MRVLVQELNEILGYARVSTHEQTHALQQDALAQAGCGHTFTDTCSGSVA